MAALEATPELGLREACEALSISRSTLYRARIEVSKPEPTSVPTPAESLLSSQPRALQPAERARVLEVLMSERFADQAPHQVYAQLLDEGIYLCSIRTMYRILESHGAVKERRDQLRHPAYQKPELLAVAPKEVWSWDITKLLGPAKWTYYYLYVIIDIYSRCVVGWMLAERESAGLASRFIQATVAKQEIPAGQLTVHADRGSSMKSGLVAQMLADLGVTKTHSRPHVSDDNPFSESQFKTLKYRPHFPQRFGSFQDAQAFCRDFFAWYNGEHRHSGIGLHTPEAVHTGLALEQSKLRAGVLLEAYNLHPERFVRKAPKPPALPTAVWINPPKRLSDIAPEMPPGTQ